MLEIPTRYQCHSLSLFFILGICSISRMHATYLTGLIVFVFACTQPNGMCNYHYHGHLRLIPRFCVVNDSQRGVLCEMTSGVHC